jgi:hypothetical protein
MQPGPGSDALSGRVDPENIRFEEHEVINVVTP